MFTRLSRIAALLLLISCPLTAALAQPVVLTTIKPLQLIAAAVMDGVAEPELLIPSSQTPHNFTLRPSDVRSLAEADLVLWVGPDMETYLTGLFEQLADSRIIRADALTGIVLLEPGSEHENEELGQRHDPHLWLNSSNALLIAQQVYTELAALDPSNESQYLVNLESFRLATEALGQRVGTQIAGISQRRYAVYHDGIQYFEEQYGLKHQFVLVPDHEIQPGIKHILEVQTLIEELEPTCLLEDINANAATTDTVFRDYPVNRVRIDTLGDAVEPDESGYVRLIDNMVLAIQSCLAP